MSKVRPRTKLVAIHPVHGYAIPPPQDVKVSRRNARERNRVKCVNNGFEILKRHIPTAAAVKKMSKVNILTQAVEYIEGLQSMLDDGPVRPATTPLVSDQTQYQTQYPGPPLTPISPNTMYYPHPHHQPHPHHPHHPHQQPPSSSYTPRHYESGYDSNQDPYQEEGKHGWQQPHQYKPLSHLTPVSPPDSSVSASSPSTAYLLPGPVNTNTSLEVREESSGEEDDILDAIAEWQQD